MKRDFEEAWNNLVFLTLEKNPKSIRSGGIRIVWSLDEYLIRVCFLTFSFKKFKFLNTVENNIIEK